MANVDVAGIHRPAGSLDAARALRPYSGPWNERWAAHLMRRAGFGGSPDEIRSMAATSASSAVESLIHFPSTANMPQPDDVFDPVGYVRAQLGTMRPGDMTDDQKRARNKGLRMQERQSILSLQAWWLDRMLNSPAPLQEKMTLYMHGHFTSAAIQKGVTPPMTLAQNQLFRSNALGNLRELTRSVSKDPAMLLYLDNALNVSSHPNENYARELMELHTLGVDGGYTQKDVQEVARAFTGWTIANPRQGGGFAFEPRMHDDGEKIVLGQKIKKGGGKHDGEEVLDVLAAHPSTAHFIATKLVRRFVSDQPPQALVDRAADRFRETKGDIREVVRTIVTSPEFFAEEAYRAKVKTPFEFVASAVRAASADTTNAMPLVQAMRELGMPPYQCQPPTGYADRADAWVNTGALLTRMNFAVALTDGRLRGLRAPTSLLNAAVETARDTITDEVLAGDLSSSTRTTVEKAARPSQAVALLLGSPEFQRR